MTETEELHRMVIAYEHAEAAYRRLMLLFAMRVDERYDAELAAAKAVRDDAEEAWRRAGARMRGVG